MKKAKMSFLQMSGMMAEAFKTFSCDGQVDMKDLDGLFTVTQVKEAADDFDQTRPVMTAAMNRFIGGLVATTGISILLKAKESGNTTVNTAIVQLLPICFGEAVCAFARGGQLWA